MPSESNDEVTVLTEEPILEQWRLLNQFRYRENIMSYIQARGKTIDADGVDFIQGSIRQSEAYFQAAASAPIDIAPLLLYYGTSNLLAGAGSLRSGARLTVTNHGLAFEELTPRIADTTIRVSRKSETGGIHNFARAFEGPAIPLGSVWTMFDLLASIPDLRQEITAAYPHEHPFTVPLDSIRTERGLVDRIRLEDLSPDALPLEVLARVERLREAYLKPQMLTHFIVLNPRIRGQDITTRSLFGHRHLLVAHKKDGDTVTLTPLLAMTMALFAFSFLSRYRPEVWNPFISTDATGEVLVITKFFRLCQRSIPNLVLDKLHGKRHRFLVRQHEIVDGTPQPSVEDIRREVRAEVRKQLSFQQGPKTETR